MNDGELLALQNADVAHDSQIATIQGDISTLQTGLATKQAIIDGGNKLNASVVQDSVRNITQEALNSDLYTQVSLKQDAINALNKLPISNVDLTGSVLENMDYTSSLSSKLTSLDNQLSTLTTLQNGDIANFQAIADNFTSIDTDIAALQTATVNSVYLSNVTSDIQTQINGITASNLPSLSYDAPTTTTTVTDICKVSTLKFADDSVQTIAFDSTKVSDLATAVSDVATLQSDMTNAQSDILTNTSAIALKQDILDATNKLPIASVDLTGSTLVNSDYTSSVTTKFAAIDTTLASQATLNSTTATNISDFYQPTNKMC
jgi:hypothetical protein